jgi:hypothetical protein
MYKKSPLRDVCVGAIRLAKPKVIIDAATSTQFTQDVIDKVDAIAKACVPDAHSSTTRRLEELASALAKYRTARVDHLVPKKANIFASPAEISDEFFAIQRTDSTDPVLAQELLVDALINSLDLMVRDLLLSGDSSGLSEVEQDSILQLFIYLAEIVLPPSL